MKYKYLPVIIVLISLLYSCSDDPVDIDYYIIKIDSLNAPDSVFVLDTLRIHLQGVIGTDGCYSFHRYEDHLGNNILDLTVWGKHVKNSVCPLYLPLLDDYYKIFLVSQGMFYINIHQPSGSIWEDSVYVR